MKMRKVLVALFFSMICGFAIGQMENPVSWNYEVKKKSADTYDVILTANVDHSWHIYSQNTGKGGPVPTSIAFKANPLIVKNGVVKELGKLEKVYDKNFKTDVLFYSDKVQFVQTVKVKGSALTNISGTVEYMVCDDSHCLPPTKKPFDLKLQ
jgi:thiol:disulfide interchange protein DsbD